MGMREYRLRVELVGLNMLSDKVREGAIRVEASIGLFGNIDETEVLPGSSCTAPMHAATDGSAYWYLPWDQTHPYLELDCEFEDVLVRMHLYNYLASFSQSFGTEVNAYKEWVKMGSNKRERAKVYYRLL